MLCYVKKNENMEQFLLGILFLLSLVALRLSGFRLLGVNAHPLAFLIWVQIFLLTIIGTLGIGLFDMPMAYNAGAAIGAEARAQVILLVFSSITVIFFGLAFLFGFRVLKSLNYKIQEGDAKLLMKFTYVSAGVIALKLLSVTEIPLLLALHGDLLGAAEAKTRILTKQTGVTVFGLNYIVRSFPSYVYITSVLIFAADRRNKNARNLFIINLGLATLDALYDVQKQAIVMLALSTFWIFYIQKGNIVTLLKGGGLATILAAAMFFLTLEYDSGQAILNDTLNRVFLAQTEGMFFIRELIHPSLKYMWLGFPFPNLFELEQIDPAAEVIQILFPGVGDTWLNSNTYFIAHAWAIFGDWAIVLGPFFLLLNIVLVLIVAQPLIKNRSVIYYAVVFWLIIKMPVVNIFTEFLWMKVVLDFFINLAFVSFVIACLRDKKKMN